MSQRLKPVDDRSSAELILDTAERLFGRHGTDGVSLRRVCHEAGLGNNYAVQYHFGDTAGLVQAILTRRMAEADRLQAYMLRRLVDEGRTSDVGALVDITLRPLLELVDVNGERVYARFIVALLNSENGHDYVRELFHVATAAAKVNRLLQEALPWIPSEILIERQRLIAIMVLSSVFNRFKKADRAHSDALLINDALNIAVAALQAPMHAAAHVTEQRRKKLTKTGSRTKARASNKD